MISNMGATNKIFNVVYNAPHIFVIFSHLSSNMGPAITVAAVHKSLTSGLPSKKKNH